MDMVSVQRTVWHARLASELRTGYVVPIGAVEMRGVDPDRVAVAALDVARVACAARSVRDSEQQQSAAAVAAAAVAAAVSGGRRRWRQRRWRWRQRRWRRRRWRLLLRTLQIRAVLAVGLEDALGYDRIVREKAAPAGVRWLAL